MLAEGHLWAASERGLRTKWVSGVDITQQLRELSGISQHASGIDTMQARRSLIAELEDAIQSSSKDKRLETLRRILMSTESTEHDKRPCLHCLLVDVIDQYFDEYTAREDNTVDTGEVILAVAKTVAEMTASQDKSGRQEIIERLMREIMNYDAEYRRQDAMGVGSDARH